jgi:hypothetical protein
MPEYLSPGVYVEEIEIGYHMMYAWKWVYKFKHDSMEGTYLRMSLTSLSQSTGSSRMGASDALSLA